MKLLVVEDSSVVRGIVVRVLREAGLDCDGVVESGSGADALRRIGTDPSIGLVLCGANVAPANGVAFLTTLRERRTSSELPVLLLTTADLDGAHAEGVNGWLKKPFTAAALRAAVEPWLARSAR